MKPLTLLTAIAFASASATASAHTPYLAPSDFAPRAGQTIALDAAFAETFFVPEAAFDASRFTVTGPDRSTTALAAVQVMKTRTVAEYTLPASNGSYRLSTGPRLGALFRSWEIDGKRVSARDPAVPIPAGAKLISNFQSLTLAETYLSVAAPDRAALAARGQGLEFVPVSHPNDLYVGEAFDFVVQYDGKPLPAQQVEVSEAVWTSDRKPQTQTLTSDANGRVRLALTQAGTFIALSRHRAAAPSGAPVPEYSHSYTLTFAVLTP